MQRNLALYPWFKFVQQLVFWQATWFLYFEHRLSAADAILLYVVYDVATTVFEVPSGYMSDRLGRRRTLLVAALAGVGATALLIVGGSFATFALANLLLGASMAFASGTDSALFFESLKAEGREAEVEAAELRAWRFGFTALALSALSGGAMALHDPLLPYIATAASATALLALTAWLREPPAHEQATHGEALRRLGASLSHPTLLWLLALALLMYVYSHIPFVFGQPFIRETLTEAGYGAQTPLASGVVTFAMMAVSLAVSLVAPALRKALGLPGVLLLAFAMQVALTAALAISNSVVVIALLFLRMAPNALSQPFVQARIQPLLPDGVRATYLSVQSLAGRLLFAATLSVAAGQTTGDAAMPYADMQVILGVYGAFGLLCLAVLAITARRAGVQPSPLSVPAASRAS